MLAAEILSGIIVFGADLSIMEDPRVDLDGERPP
jgi:hypothetical protein